MVAGELSLATMIPATILEILGSLKTRSLSRSTLSFFFFVDISKLGLNEFLEPHDEIKDAIIDAMRQKIGTAARHISAVIEGMVKKK
ncbi:MAG: hypothetical protein GY799_10280 [Desulfobulbaceae bacterium]|nr:hypothetical protein [Desulfobulbaceae bacterium]